MGLIANAQNVASAALVSIALKRLRQRFRELVDEELVETVGGAADLAREREGAVRGLERAKRMSANPTSDAPCGPESSVLQEELALAALAFRGSQSGGLATQTKHLAWLPADSLDLDLSDPAQRQFGDYKLVEKLGEGGMGVVYRAQQLGLDREVAIKVLSAGPWAAPDFVKRFRAEAQSAARMQHPNIVPIYEIGVHDELVFYSMRLVRGPNLGQWLAQHGPRDPRQAAMDLRTIAEAVHYAHQLGVLHLDLKPDNILIDERGWPQVADFGLARRLDHTLSAEIEEISERQATWHRSRPQPENAC